MMIYANKMHSYKDLPIRIGEIAHDFRFEASGTLKGPGNIAAAQPTASAVQ